MRYLRARSPAARTSFASFNNASRKLYKNKQKASLAARNTHNSNTRKITVPNSSSVEISKTASHFTHITIICYKPQNFSNVVIF